MGSAPPGARTENAGRRVLPKQVQEPFVNGGQAKAKDVQYSRFLISVYSMNELTDE